MSTEIQVLTEEQISELPKDAVKEVAALNKSLVTEQLQIFVPVVQQYIDLRDRVSKLKLEKDEDGKIKKDSLQEYKSIKKEIGSFNTMQKEKIKEIKDPINAIRADIISVDKTFKSESDKLKEAIQNEFKEWEDEQQRKREEAKAKKEAAMRAEIEEANARAEEERKKSEVSHTINAIKYDEIMGNITGRANQLVNTLNIASLKSLVSEFKNKKFLELTLNYDVSLIEDETMEKLKSQFEKEISSSIALIENKIKSLEKEKAREIEKAQQEVAPAPEPQNTIPEKPAEDVSNEYFLSMIKGQLSAIEDELETRIQGGKHNPEIIQLYSKLKSINA